jgi:hypothetical protein
MPWVKPQHRHHLIAALTSEQLAASLLLLSVEQAGRWLAELDEDDRIPIMNCMPPKAIPVLLSSMPGQNRDEVIAAMAPTQANATRETLYERGVAEAFGRTNVTVSHPQGAPPGIFIVQVFGRSIAVTPIFYEEDVGTLSTQDLRYAQNMAIELQAAGALVVSNTTLSEDVTAYRKEARRQGWIFDIVTWIDRRHDGLLQRALVSLIR